MMAKDIPTFTVNMDEKCKQCGKKGAVNGGICMKCMTKNLKSGKYDHIIKKGK